MENLRSSLLKRVEVQKKRPKVQQKSRMTLFFYRYALYREFFMFIFDIFILL